MKRTISLLLSFVLLLVLCACQQEPPAPTGTDTPTGTTSTADTVATDNPSASDEPVYVYEGAVEDYLLPMEDFSWERKYAPEYIMLHFTSAVVDHPDDPYNIQHIRQIYVDYHVSAHYVVDRDGTVHCYIPENRAAWHAGKGQWNNDPKFTDKMNLYSIGIELLAIGSQDDMSIYLTPDQYEALDDSLKGYTQAQYDALELLLADLCSRYDIPADREHIIGHQEYSPKKVDPGELFDWSQILP